MIAEYSSPLITLLNWLTAPVSWPIAKALDYIIGEHKLVRYDNEKLKALVKMHCVDTMKDSTQGTDTGLSNM